MIQNELLFFTLLIAVVIILNFFIFSFKDLKAKCVTFRASVTLIFWFIATVIFSLYLNIQNNHIQALEFITGYLVELALSIDNIFIFILLFGYFKITPKQQLYLLNWGVYGAILMRILMILFGTYLINNFSWVFYIFGIFLIYAGVSIVKSSNKPSNLKSSRFYTYLQKKISIVHSKDNSLFIRKKGKLYITHLFIALIFIEKADLVFALDSIPAILAITHDPVIIITSNILAILCLRALYFIVKHVISKFIYIKYALALILCFIGIKMFMPLFDLHLPIYISLGFIVVTLVTTAILSVYKNCIVVTISKLR